MRIVFLTHDDPLYVLSFFDEFFRYYAGEFECRQVTASRAMGKRPRRQLLKEVVVLYGLPGFARIGGRLAIAWLLGGFPRSQKANRFFTLAQLCRAYRVPFVSAGNPNAPDHVEGVRKLRPDVIVSVACPYILKEPLLNLPARSCLNIHHAPLPRYKGMMPTFWQMYHGHGSVGLTIHTMTSRIDEGEALLREQLPIEGRETLDHLIRRSKRHAAHCLAQVLREMEEGNQHAWNLEGEGSYFTFPTAQEIREFYRRGCRAI